MAVEFAFKGLLATCFKRVGGIAYFQIGEGEQARFVSVKNSNKRQKVWISMFTDDTFTKYMPMDSQEYNTSSHIEALKQAGCSYVLFDA